MSIHRIAAYIWRHYPPARDWGAELLVRWLAWHMNNRGVCIVKDEDESIRGVGVARLVMNAEDGAHNGVLSYEHDNEGAVVFIDLAVTCHPDAIKILLLKIRERFGMRDRIAFLRLPDTRIRTYSLDAFKRRFFPELATSKPD